MNQFIESANDWLLDRAFNGDDLTKITAGLGQRLNDAGCPVARMSIGRIMLHPALGVATLEWDLEHGQAVWNIIPRSGLNQEYVRSTPFGKIRLAGDTQIYADFAKPDDVARFPLFAKLAGQGMTAYVAFGRSIDNPKQVFPEIQDLQEGTAVSFATRRMGGFAPDDLDLLKQLILPLFVCVRIATEKTLVSSLMETYLGRLSGARVLTGQTTRGDGRSIDCALFYSDMRGSVEMSERLGTSDFLDCVNQYFDCTAQAVMTHGGEVLKFIGDGVLAIFPLQEKTRPEHNMCRAAVSAAREAFARARQTNEMRRHDGSPEFSFGVALHVGNVIYGNVGTEKRLDFTATGAAVGQVARCENLTRTLNEPLLATSDFVAHVPDGSRTVGLHSLRGFAEPVELFAYDL